MFRICRSLLVQLSGNFREPLASHYRRRWIPLTCWNLLFAICRVPRIPSSEGVAGLRPHKVEKLSFTMNMNFPELHRRFGCRAGALGRVICLVLLFGFKANAMTTNVVFKDYSYTP